MKKPLDPRDRRGTPGGTRAQDVALGYDRTALAGLRPNRFANPEGQEPQRGGSSLARSIAPGSDPAEQAWQRAVRWLAAHDRSEQEIRLRLGALAFTPAVIDQTISRLRALRYLDETRFAHVTAEQAARRGRGSDYVRAQLVAKGVPEHLIDAAIGAAFADETALARRVLSGRYPAPPAHHGERAKAARFLGQRGFPEAVVAVVVGDDG